MIDPTSPEHCTISTREQWAECLSRYNESGQQDNSGDMLRRVTNFSNASGIAVAVREKTRYPPNRLPSLWYNTARFEEVYEENSVAMHETHTAEQLVMPCWSSWLRIAHDIAPHLPVYSNDMKVINFAGELASASLIMARYPLKHRDLVTMIYEDGLKARWTLGWSGLLSCFSLLWTLERIHIAMLNGLSLLAMSQVEDV